MFDIGFLELALLFVIGLLVLGPERMPRVARTIGGYLRRARETWNSLRREIERELDAEDLKRQMQEPAAQLGNELESLRKSAQEKIDLEPKPAADAAKPDKPAAAPDPTEAADDGR